MGTMFGLFLVLAAIFFYMLPYINAKWNGHHNASAILLLNLLLGWTLIGWVAALVWSATKKG